MQHFLGSSLTPNHARSIWKSSLDLQSRGVCGMHSGTETACMIWAIYYAYCVLCWFSCFPPNRLADLMSLCRWPKKCVFFFLQAETGRFSIISRIWEGDEWQGNKLVFFSINPHLTTPTRHVMVGITRSKIVYFLRRFLDLPSYFDLSECMLL